MKPKLYIASCSFGKDSIATILLALKHNEPIDRVLFSEVMFDHDKGISGESPEHINWIYNTAIPMLEGMGLRVDVVRSKKDYKDEFYHTTKKGKHIGKISGFPLGGACIINRELKVKPIREYIYELKKSFDVVQYIGIAIDEPKRLERLHNSKDEKNHF
jgi:3'-phosphoadenosine 5'-phosphosulfate sulfotransferase (PAPS reductase)/FAD synthetase